MAMFENSEKLDAEIIRLSDKLKNLEPTSDGYKAIRINLDTLYKLRNDQYKIDTEDLEKRDKADAENKQKAEELKVRERETESAVKRIEMDAAIKEKELALRERELELAARRLEFEERQKNEENDAREYELQFAEKQHEDNIKSQKANRTHEKIVCAANIVAGVLKLTGMCAVTWVVADKGYQFEKTGVPTSRTFKDEMKTFFDVTKEIFKKS